MGLLFPGKDREIRVGDVRFPHQILEMIHDVGLRGRQVVLFAGVLVQVVEFIPLMHASDVQVDQLPRTFPDGLAPAEFLEFEV